MGQASSSPTSSPSPSPASASASASAAAAASTSASTRPTHASVNANANANANDRRRRSSLWRHSFSPPTGQPDECEGEDVADRRPSRPRPGHSRSSSINRLSQLLHSSSNLSTTSLQRPSRIQRARTSLSNFGARHSPFSRPSPADSSATDPHDLDVTRTSTPDLDLNLDRLLAHPDPTPPTPSSRSSFRIRASLSDRLSSLRSDRSARNLAMSTRRTGQGRRTPSDVAPDSTSAPAQHWEPLSLLNTPPATASSTQPGSGSSAQAGSGVGTEEGGQTRAGGEDNTALLSRLLSVAAAATAATLLDGNQQAIAEARSVAGDGDDGTFSSFLQSLESGRLASALRQGGQSSAPGSTNTPLNFFRMFRFGSGAARDTAASRSGNNETPPSAQSDGRMVPIIIVGIRSVNPAASNNQQDPGMPPFLDALSALPTTPFDGESDSIDNILRPAHRFSHRRRASMGGINNFPSAYDAQRHHSSPDRTRPRSMASNAAPTLSLSPSLSRVSSANSVAAAAPTSRPPSSRSNSNYSDRRESIIRTTTTTTTLETTAEDAPLRPRAARPRRLSESDYGRRGYSSRRNGIVEPDNAPAENTRSWIIYVLGGSYPENHPILTTPSLFTDSPTYEDMMLLSALLGPAKPPVASEQDVADAPGIFRIEVTDRTLTAVAVDGGETVPLTSEQRCLVCLCDFESGEEARRLVKCSHLFHKECIDQWLTKGRNSCPLCRGQGVDEKEKPPAETTSSSLSADDSAAATLQTAV